MLYTTISTTIHKNGTHDTIVTKHDEWSLTQINKLRKAFGNKPITMLGHCNMVVELESFSETTQITFISEA